MWGGIGSNVGADCAFQFVGRRRCGRARSDVGMGPCPVIFPSEINSREVDMAKH